MKKFVVAAVAIVGIMAITLCLDAQPAGGGMMGGGGMMAGGRGMRGMRVGQRPPKAERLAAVAELEKQIAALKAAIENAPAEDPNIADLKDAALTKFMDSFTVESNALNAVQNTMASLSGTGAGARGGMRGFGGFGGPSTEILNELKSLAQSDDATKTSARIDALITEAQDREAMMQNMRGGGMMGGGAGGRGAAGGAPGGGAQGGT